MDGLQTSSSVIHPYQQFIAFDGARPQVMIVDDDPDAWKPVGRFDSGLAGEPKGLVTAAILDAEIARENTPHYSDPQLQAALEQGRSTENPALRAKAYQTVNKRLAIDLPYLWLDRAVWSVESTLKVQNWNNPTTPSGSKAYGMIGGSIWPTQIWLS